MGGGSDILCADFSLIIFGLFAACIMRRGRL